MKKIWIRRWIIEGLATLGGRGSAAEILRSHSSLRSRSVAQVHTMAQRMGLPKERENGTIYYKLPE